MRLGAASSPRRAVIHQREETLPTIALDRRFSEWRAGDISDPDLVLRFMRSADLLTWENLLARRRVVILAEVGSGKTEEMRE
jgi:hypothetical protein